MASTPTSFPTSKPSSVPTSIPTSIPTAYPSPAPSAAIPTPLTDILCMIIPSSFSMVATTVMIAALWYHRRDLLKKQSFQILLYIAISDFMTAAGSVVGLPDTDTFACWWQGIVTNVFTLSSIFWNMVLMHLLLTICLFKPYKINIYTHLLCWGLPLAVTLIPLYNMTIVGGDSWCFFGETESSPPWGLIFWYWMSYYTWIWLSFAFMAFVMVFIIVKILGQFLRFILGELL